MQRQTSTNTTEGERAMEKRIIKSVRILIAIVATGIMWTSTAAAATLTWNVSGYTGTWDTTSTNWLDSGSNPAVFQTGDDVIFPTFNTLGGGSHYTNQTITIAAGGVSPGSINFTPAEINWLHFAGGDIAGTAGGITLDSTWSADQARMHFDHDASLSFTGNVNVKAGNRLYYPISTAGTYGLGSGDLVFDAGGTSTATEFWYNPTATGTILTNDIEVQSGMLQFFWENAPTFSGDLNLSGGNVHFPHPGGGNRYFTWTGNVNLTADGEIHGGVRDTGGIPLDFSGQFNGPTHTLTLDFDYDPNVIMQATAVNPWNVGNLIITDGGGSRTASVNAPNLWVNTPNATDDHFAALRANGGKVTIQNDAVLVLINGTVQGDDFRGGTGTSKILIPQDNTANDVRVTTTPLRLGNTNDRLNILQFTRGNLPAVGSFSGDIIVDAGGTLKLATLYGHLARHDAGNLTLLDGGTLDAAWSGSDFWSGGYRLDSASQQIILGDGNAATTETITFRGKGAAGSGVFNFGTDTANVVDDGATILRYESYGDKRFNMGWTDLASVQTLSYANNNVAYQFRGGSVGTEFAPQSATYDVGAIGPSSGTVFTATTPTSLVTTGTVGFYNSNGTYAGHRGTAGTIIIDNGGTFNLTAAGTVIASALTVQNTGSISGIGTFQTDVTVNTGTVSPGNSIGTLTIDGDAAFNNGSTLVIEIGGPGNTDILNVTGTMSIDSGSTLQLVWTEGYDPGLIGGSFDIFDVGTYNLIGGNEFALDTSLAPISSYLHWDTSELYTTGIITAIPEPTTAILILLGACTLLRRRR